MSLRKGKRVLPTKSNRGLPSQNRPLLSFLDLPTEIRLMVYWYAIGYHEAQWAMTNSKFGFVLVRGDLRKEADSRRKKRRRRRPLALLKVCKLFHQETLPLLYNKIRFDITFNNYLYLYDQRLLESRLRTRYHLQLTNGRSQLTRGLTQVVLQRVKHICVFMNERSATALL